MARLFPELPDALSNSVRIAEQCSVDPLAYKAKLPTYTIPPAYDNQGEYLYAICLQGVKERFGEMSEAIHKQLDYEFNMIVEKGFAPYFLIEWDFVNYARSQGIRCSARGSAAGSLLAYVLGITNVDPLRYQLPFERFFNTERADMPDIDMVVRVFLCVQFREVPPDRVRRRFRLISLFTLFVSIYSFFTWRSPIMAPLSFTRHVRLVGSTPSSGSKPI